MTHPRDIAPISIAVGGIAGFSDLADPANSAALRKLGGTMLYIHDYVWTRTSVAKRRAILANFDGPADVEFGLVTDAKGWFDSVYQDDYLALGVRGQRGHVNVLARNLQSDWRPFVDAARARGFLSLAPILAPNQGEYRTAPFQDLRWQPYRDAARYGGALTIDAPVDLFLSQPSAYRIFVETELRWARAEHLHTAFILSPGNAAWHFEAETIAVADQLRAAGTLPDEFIVETYEGGRQGYPNRVGNDTDPQSITGTARLLALHLRGQN
ncbi:hypothetical protein [Lichenicoccus sp.]|uniref:hypothetical protein n=1 Tax=Lichenicoccus sp. TaxID=2781899 RepID=UPI003D0EBC66